MTQSIKTNYPLEVYLNIRARFAKQSTLCNSKLVVSKKTARQIIGYTKISSHTNTNKKKVWQIHDTLTTRVLYDMDKLGLVHIVPRKGKVELL